ncbi:acyltransferase family protein [bacterium]|nr:acyltransferase family protein [bacterium]
MSERSGAIASVWYFVFAVWPIAAFAGGLAFSPLLALAGLIALAPSARQVSIRFYMIPLALALGFATISAMWSPREVTLLDFDFEDLSFAVRSEPLRLALTTLLAGVMIASTRRLAPDQALSVARFATFAIVAQGVSVAILTMFEADALKLFSGWMPDEAEGVQNLTRNGLVLAAAAPLAALGLSRGRSGGEALAIAGGVAVVAAMMFLIRGVQAGVLAIVAGSAAALLVAVFQKRGFVLLAAALAGGLLSAPLLFGFLSRAADPVEVQTSGEWRLAIWRRVCDLIAEQPWFGSGLGVLRTIKETFPAGPLEGQLLVPNHPHNMFLQIWAETGAVGACLVAAGLILLGLRLPTPASLGRVGFAAAALIASLAVIASVSFDLWNDWWWALCGLLVGLLSIWSRTDPSVWTKARSEGVGLVAGGFAPAQSPATLDDERSASSDAPAAGTQPGPSQSPTPRPEFQNNFNSLRLLFAFAVVIYHLVVLSGMDSWAAAAPALSIGAELGVQGFFVLSGYLVYASLERSSNLLAYADKRVRRLYPAYAAVVITCAIAAVALVPAARESAAGVAQYLGWNLLFLNLMSPELPGVFGGNPQSEVNGALWTLKIEVLFYLVLPPLAFVLRRAGQAKWALIILIYIGAELWRALLPTLGEAGADGIEMELARQLPGQMSFFIVGVALYMLRDAFTWRSALPILGVALLAGSIAFPAIEGLRALGLGVVVIWIGAGLPAPFDAARFGDLSYGVYIVHFPLIQVLVATGVFAASPWLAAGLSILLTLVVAFVLWRLVERPALRRDSAYRHAE